MPRASLAARIAAVLGPALVLGAALALLSHREPWVPSEAVRAYDRILEHGADIVAVGNSKVHTDLDETLLARGLGADPHGVARLRQCGAKGPSLYAMLKYRVVDAGYRPRLLLVFTHLKPMLETGADSAYDLAQLTRHFAEPDGVLAHKTLGGSPWLTHVRERRTRFHDRLMTGLRYAAAGAVLGGAGAAEAREATDDALERVFALDRVETGAEQRRVIPIVEVRDRVRATSEDPASSYIPDMVALARQAGARIIFVRTPVAPARAYTDHVPPDVERRLIRLLNELGAGWVDMADLPWTEAQFMDDLHMNAEGRSMLTEALAARLGEMGVLEGGPVPPAAVPTVPVAWTRDGTPPAIEAGPVRPTERGCARAIEIPAWTFLDERAVAAAGLGPVSPILLLEDGAPLRQRTAAKELSACSGAFAHVRRRVVFTPSAEGSGAGYAVTLDPALPLERAGFPAVWWVYPGTAVTWSFDEGWDATAGPFRVRVQGAAFGTRPGRAEMAVGDRRAVLTPDPALADDPVTRGDLVAVVAGGPPAGPWTLAVRSPADGPFLAIRTLSFGEGDAEDLFIGAEPSATISLLQVTPRWMEHPLPPLPPATLTVQDGIGSLLVPGTAHLSDERLQLEKLAGRCSPLAPTRDGEVITAGGHNFLAALKGGEAGWTHLGDTLLFRPADGVDPLVGGHAWGVAWDPRRTCRQRRWLLPGDTMVATPRGDRVRLQRRPLGTLLLGAVATAEADPSLALGVTVRSAERTWLEAHVPLASLGFAVTLPLDEPIPLQSRAIEAELTLPGSAPPVIVTKLVLGEAEGPVAAP